MTAKDNLSSKHKSDIATAWEELGDAVTGDGGLTDAPAPLIAEGFIHFSREVSIIAVRSQNGDICYYPLVENHHTNGILSKPLHLLPTPTISPSKPNPISVKS